MSLVNRHYQKGLFITLLLVVSFFVSSPTNAAGLSVGNTTLNLAANENIFYGVTAGTNTAGKFLLFEKGAGNNVFSIDYAGNITTTGNLVGGNTFWTANGTSIFSSNTGNVGIGVTSPRAKLDVLSSDGSSPSIITGNIIEVAGYKEVAQSATITTTGGSLNSGGPTSRNGLGNWAIPTFPLTITLDTRGWWSYGGISFTADNVHNYPAGGGNKLPASFLVEASPDNITWTTVDDVTGYTSALYYKSNLIGGSGRFVRITARAPQAGETTSKIANIQIFDTYRTGKGPFTVSPEGNAVFIGGNVGIGRTNPATALDVNGTVTALAFSGTYNGTITAPNVSSGAFGANTGGGNYSFPGYLDIGKVDTSNLFRLNYDTTNGGSMQSYIGGAVAKMSLNPGGGNVGIGTTNPGAKLDVVGGSAQNVTGLILRNNTWACNQSLSLDFWNGSNKTANPASRIVSSMDGCSSGGERLGFFTQPAGGDLLASVENMTIRASGNVGIGTTAPGAYKLRVNGNAGIVREDVPYGVLEIGGLYTGSTYWNAKIVGDYYGNQYNANVAHGMSFIGGRAGQDNFRWFKSDYTEMMTLKDSGNLGIGTTAPGTINSVAFSGVGLHVNNGTLGRAILDGSNQAELLLNDSGSTINTRIRSIVSDGGNLGFNAVDDNGTQRRHLTINNSGNVGINTTNPGAYRLNVNGDTNITGTLNVTGSITGSVAGLTVSAPNVSSGAFGTNTGGGNYSFPASVAIGTSDTSGGNLTVRGLVTDRTIIGHSSGDTNSNSPKLSFFGGTSAYITGPSIQKINEASFGRGGLGFFTHAGADYASESEVMRLSYTGNLGIGTVAPGVRLQINGGDQSVPTLGAAVGGLALTGSNNLYGLYAGVSTNGDTWLQSQRNDTSTATYRLLLNPLGGSVGVGTTNPTRTLTVTNGGGNNGQLTLGQDPSYYWSLGRENISNGNFNFTSKDARYNGGAETVLFTIVPGTGNVGIGTTGPSNLLTINQAANTIVSTQGSYGIMINNQTSNSLSFGSDSTYAYIQSWNGRPLNINSQGNNVLFTGSGSVGINTIAPGAYKLNVNGDTNITGNLNVTGTITGGGLTGVTVAAPNVSSGEFGVNTGGGNYIFGATISGNVGIGTIGPRAKLEIVSGINNSEGDVSRQVNIVGPNYADNSANLSIQTNDAEATGLAGSIAFGGRYSGTGFANFSKIKGGKETGVNGEYGGYLGLFTRVHGGSLTEQIRIQPNGYVGIGLTAPGQKLDVAGAIRTNNQFISTLVAGTAPLVVTSNTLNTNLNADLLDGYHARYTLTPFSFDTVQHYYWNKVAHLDGGYAHLNINAYSQQNTDGNAGVAVNNITVTLRGALDNVRISNLPIVNNRVAGGAKILVAVDSNRDVWLYTQVAWAPNFYFTVNNAVSTTVYNTNTYQEAQPSVTTVSDNESKLITYSTGAVLDTQIIGLTNLDNVKYGIGTTNPATALDVNGTVTALGFSGPYNGTVTAPNVSSGAFGGNTGGGNYSFPGTLGVGTTNPVAKFGVAIGGTGNFVNFTGAAGDNLVMGNDATGLYQEWNANTAGESVIRLQTRSAGAGNYVQLFLDGGNQNMRFNTNGGEKMRIDGSGNVGIGLTNPYTALQVKGKAQFDNSNTFTNYTWAGGTVQTNSVEIVDRVGGSTGDGVYPTLTFHDYGNGGAQFSMEGVSTTLHLGSGQANSAGALGVAGGYFSKLKVWGAIEATGIITAASFSGALNGTVTAPNVSAGAFGANTGGGNYTFPGGVGIGSATVNASNKLNVVGGGLYIAAADGHADASLHITTSYGGFDRLTQIAPTGLSKPGFNLMGSTDAAGTNQWWSWGVTSSNLWAIQPGSSGFSGSSGLFVNTSGNVGIGTIAPGVKLDVANGIIRQSGYSVSDAATDNMVVNGDFEMGNTSGWEGGAISTSAFAGKYAISYTGGSTLLNSDYIPVNPVRDVFQLEAWVKKSVAGTTPGILYFGYIAYDENKAGIYTSPCGTYCYFAAAGYTIPVDGNWHKVSATTAGEGTSYPNFPVGTKYVRVLGLINYSSSGDAVTLVDHITLKRLTNGPLIVGNNFSGTNWVDQNQYSKLYTTSANHLILETQASGNVGINNAAPSYTLDVSGTGRFTQPVIVGSPSIASHAATKSYVDSFFGGAAQTVGDLNMGGYSIKNVNKLTVNTIDPLYNIKGINYSTFAAAIAGGVKEEYVGKDKLAVKNANGEYEHVIDFDQEKIGSDLWVWRQTVDFSDDNVQVLMTPSGRLALTYYVVTGNKITLRSDKPVTISYRLIGRRLDWQKWPTKAFDQKEKAGFIIK